MIIQHAHAISSTQNKLGRSNEVHSAFMLVIMIPVDPRRYRVTYQNIIFIGTCQQ